MKQIITVLLIYLTSTTCRADSLAGFAEEWLCETDCYYDYTGDGKVNISDYAKLAVLLATTSNVFGIAEGGRCNVAAVDSTNADKARSRFVCDGIADQETINAAINALPIIDSSAGGLSIAAGEVHLSAGNYNITGMINLRSGMILSGEGPSATNINYTGNDTDFTAIGYGPGITDTSDPLYGEYLDSPGYFTTVRDLGTNGNPQNWLVNSPTATGNRTGVGIALNKGNGSKALKDSKVVNCWAAYWPSAGFSSAAWNNQLMYSCAEFCGTGVNGFSEITNCHLKYCATGAIATGDCKVTACRFFRNNNFACLLSATRGTDSTAKPGPTLNGCELTSNWWPLQVMNVNGKYKYNFISPQFSGWWNVYNFFPCLDEVNGSYFLYVVVATDKTLAIYKTMDWSTWTCSELVAHSATIPNAGETWKIVADNGSGIWPYSTLKSVVAPVAGTYAICFGNRSSIYGCADVQVSGDRVRVVNNSFVMAGDGVESMATYAILGQAPGGELGGNDLIIANNTIYGNYGLHAAIFLKGAQAIVQGNNITSRLYSTPINMGLPTQRTGIDYSTTSAANSAVSGNIIRAVNVNNMEAATLRAGQHIDQSADNTLIAE